MRVIAGSAGGIRLAVPKHGVRPTMDRVKAAIFSSLGDAIVGARVLDLFAGSGALGIEALSRGAVAATFVDTSQKAVDAVRANLESTGLTGPGVQGGGPRIEVIRADAHRYDDGPFELALLDPPYATTDEEWAWLLDHLDAQVVVLESDREIDLGDAWEVLRSKRYGNTM